MTRYVDVGPSSAPPLAQAARGLVRFVCTSNPFYVISAGLFLIGLRVSFGAQAHEVETWALMSGLAGYTLLLAGTALLLVRYANAWDDLRTVLLLVVLMFLATSVTFDEVLVLDWRRGVACYTLGLGFAVAVSEGILRGIRLRLPARFRVPYHLILALFFLYPLALRPLVDPTQPRSEPLLWGLLAFSAVAGLVFLTLLPAIRRGPEYLAENGSPWRWPLYPWVLFGLLALAVPARAFLLCYSMHFPAAGQRDLIVFGPYFLVPFGFVVAALLLEIGIVARSAGAMGTALAFPPLLVVLSLAGHRSDPLYHEFLELVADRLGATPLFITALAALAFYGYAAARRVPWALEGVTAALAGLAFVSPDTFDVTTPLAPHAAPLLAAGLLQLGLGAWQRNAWRCVIGSAAFVAGALAALPGDGELDALRWPLAYHLVMVAVLAVGAAFDDERGRALRGIGTWMALLAVAAVLFGHVARPTAVPAWLLYAHPVALAALLAVYGWLLGYRPSQAVAAVILGCWLLVSGGQGYVALRQLVAGLDHLVISLVVFAVAVLVSLGKAGLLRRWMTGWGWVSAGGDRGPTS